MENHGIKIRLASPDDAAALLEIYGPYVEKTAITFEYSVPTVDEFAQRIENTLKKYPYFVAECGGVPAGYAYASPFKERAAYGWSVETTIYVKSDKKRMKIGTSLYEALEQTLKKQGILNVNACIACTDEEDEYLTNDSVHYHEKKVIKWWENFISAVISSDAGITWCGWRKSLANICRTSRM